MKTEKPGNKIALRYVGKRVALDGSVHHCFTRGKEEFFWANAGYVRIGCYYEAEQVSTGMRMDKRFPKEVVDKVKATPEQVKLWTAQHRAAEQAQARKRSFNSFKRKEDLLERHISELRSVYKKLSFFERDYFLDYVRTSIRRTK